MIVAIPDDEDEEEDVDWLTDLEDCWRLAGTVACREGGEGVGRRSGASIMISGVRTMWACVQISAMLTKKTF